MTDSEVKKKVEPSLEAICGGFGGVGGGGAGQSPDDAMAGSWKKLLFS